MAQDSSRAAREAMIAARGDSDVSPDVHKRQFERGLQRHLAVEAIESLHRTAPSEAPDQATVDSEVSRRRRLAAAERMREQVNGADEIPRAPRRRD